MHAWLKANVTDGTVTDWIVDAIQRKISESKPIEPVVNRPFSDLLRIRKKWVNMLCQDPNYLDEFESLEHFLFTTMSGGYDIDELKATRLSGVPENLKKLMWSEYFTRLDALDYYDSDDARRAFDNAIQDDEMRRLCGRDAPDKVIYGKFTAEDIIRKIDKNQTYTVTDIAVKLSINYKQAYTYIVPWLISHGFNVKLSSSHSA
ncbi:hypothetical protein MUO79_05625 [Candidatus Bathyarchaeota archaeon]|nr:hypothetical protein [Candidatus Bathyarchaeota archaeon]